jgi:hypothetical protein
MPNNYVLLEKITVGETSLASVTFSNIPQTGYTDLVVKLSTRSTSNGGYTFVSFNGSTSSYATKDIVNSNGTPSSASYSLSGGVSWQTQSSYTASTFTASEVYILNYTSSNQKTFLLDSSAENNSTNYAGGLEAARWSNTAAITSITLTPNTGNYAQYSTFYLYGVAKLNTTPAIAPKATGGNIIDTDGTYWYHTFLSSGTFTPATDISCHYLVVAGGGGGGTGLNSGGGGAGGLRSTVGATGGGGSLESALSLTKNSNYTVTVGGGGSRGASNNTVGVNGSNSVFSTITSAGGGGGGGSGSLNGLAGGSGGGGGLYETTGGAGTSNQGYAGGAALEAATKGFYAAGGGGGAGAVGTSGNISVLGAGGVGIATSISGTSTYYAGGGGGGANGGTASGGLGGGGTAGQSGTANRGGGGGGGGNSGGNTNGNGGSGIVIVRYPV